MLRFLAMTSLLCGVTFNSCNDKADVINGNDLGRDCSCPLGSIVTTAGSTDTLRMEAGRDIGGSVGLSIPLKKFIQAEVEAGLDITAQTERTTTFFETIENNFSEEQGIKNTFEVSRVYTCARYVTNCRDRSLSDSTLRVEMQKDLDASEKRLNEEWEKKRRRSSTGHQQVLPAPSATPKTVTSNFQGTIYDRDRKNAITGAEIRHKGQKWEADHSGYYSFEVEGNYSKRKLEIRVSKPGFRDSLFYIRPGTSGQLYLQPL